MSKYSNTIEYKIKTSADLKGIQDLQTSLTQVTTTLNKMHLEPGVDHMGLDKSLENVQKLQDALTKAFNPKLGIINGQQLQKEIGNIGVDTLINDLDKAGASGRIAINNLVGGLGKVHTNLNTISSAVDKVINTFGNTIRWGITASIFETMSNNLNRSVEFVKDLDTSLNNIQIVSGQSNEQMKAFAGWASQAGQSLGRSTIEIVDAAQIFAQNGFNIEDQKKLAELTNEVANVTQQSSETASSQITSLMNGYKLSINEAKDALDAMALVAAESASDLNELATAETRVASLAHDLGVSQNQLTAQLSTMVSVTRQAPETVGNALRSIYARIADLKLGQTLEDGVNLGKVSGALDSIGVHVLDASGEMREMGDIIEDLMEKWENLDRAQQQALAITVAGKQQVNMFQTLMSNTEMYRDTLKTAEGAIGTLDEQQEIFMESAVAKIQSLSAAGEGLINSLFNADNYKPALDTLINFINVLQNVVDSVGGGLPVLTAFTSMFLKLGNHEISSSLGEFLFNRRQNKEGAESDEYNSWLLSTLGGSEASTTSAYKFTQEHYGGKQVKNMNAADQQEYNRVLQETVDTEKALIASEHNYDEALKGRIEQEEKEHDLTKQGIKLYIDESHQIKALEDEFLKGTIETSYIDDLEGSIMSLEEIETVLQDDNEISEEWKETISEVVQELKDAKKILGTEYDYEVFTDTKVNELRNLAKQKQNEKDEREAIAEQYNSGEYQPSETPEVARARQEYEVQQTNVRYKEREQKDFIDKQKIKEQVRSVMELTDGLTSLFFVWQSFSSLGNIISDENLSNTEKFDAIVNNLVISLPMLLNGVTDTANGLKGLKSILSSAGGVTGLLNKFVAFTGNSGLVKNLAGLVPGFSKLTIATAAAEAGTLSLGTALSTLALPIGVVVAAVAGLAIAFKSTYDYVHRFDTALEKANKNLKAAQQETKDAQEDLSSMKSGLQSVRDMDDSFNGLKEGTKEWNEKLLEANENVLTLIENFPQLAKYLETGVNGQLTISAEGEEKMLEEATMRVAKNQISQIGAVNAQLKAENEKLIHDTNIIVPGQISGYAYGTGTTTALNLTDTQKTDLSSYLSKNPTATAQDLVDNNLVPTVQSAEKILETNRDKLIELGDKVEEATVTVKSTNEGFLKATLSNNEDYNKLSRNEKVYVETRASKEFEETSRTYKEVVAEIGEATSKTQEQWEELYRETKGLDADAEINKSVDEMREVIISAGIAEKLLETNGLLSKLNEQAQLTEDKLISVLGESGPEIFNAETKSFDFNGVNFQEYMNFKELDPRELYKDNLPLWRSLGMDSLKEFVKGYQEGIDSVDFSTLDLRLNGNLEDDIKDTQDKMTEALKAIRKDTELTADEYRGFLSDSLLDSLDAINITSESIGSVYDLLYANGIKAEQAIYAMNNALNDQQHALQKADIEWLLDQYETLEKDVNANIDAMEKIDKTNIILHLDDKQVEDAYNKLMTLYDISRDMENQSFTFLVDSSADTIDAAEDIIDVLDDIVVATQGVEDEFLVAADDVDELAKAFPGILEGYSVTTEGMIKLNSSLVQTLLTGHAADATSSIEAQKTKLSSLKTVVMQMAELYKAEAADLREKAAQEVATELEAQDIIEEKRKTVSEATVNYSKQVGLDFNEVASEVGTINEETTSQIADSFAEATDSAGKNMKDFETATLETFKKIIDGALDVSQAIVNIGDPSKVQATRDKANAKYAIWKSKATYEANSTYKGPKSTAEDRENAHREHIQELNFNKLTPEEQEELAELQKRRDEVAEAAKKMLEDEADSFDARATIYENLSNQIEAEIAKLEGKAAEFQYNLDQVGIPDPEDEKYKSTKDLVEPELVEPEEIKKEDYLDEEADRYERINAILAKIAGQFTRIANEQDRVTGNDYAKNIAQQINLLQQQIAAEERKLEIQQQEAEQLRANLEAQGAAFDAGGFVTNANAVYQELQKQYNDVVDAYDNAQRQAQENYIKELNTVKETQAAIINELIEQYNAAVAGSDEEKRLKEAITKAEAAAKTAEEEVEKAYETLQKENEKYYQNLLQTSKDTFEKFKEDLSRYDELYSQEIEQTMNNIEEYKNKIEDLQIEAYKRSVEAMKNIKDLKQTLIDIKGTLSQIRNGSDPLAKMSASIQKLRTYWDLGNGKGAFDLQREDMELLMDQIEQFKSTGSSSIFGENSKELYEAAKNSVNSFKELLSSYAQEIENLENAFSTWLQNMLDRTDRVLDRFNMLNEEMEFYARLIEMTWGDKSAEALYVLYNNQVKNNENHINALGRVIENYKEMQDALDTSTEEGLEKWNTIQDQILAKQKEIWQLTENTVEILTNKLKLQNTKALENWEKSLLNGSTIDELAEQWEVINRNAEQYLDAVESAYEVQKLQNKYMSLADNSSNLATQQRILKAMKDQMKYLQGQTELSQYQVDYANAQYEILQKTIALEESRNNKNQMQLRRDRQGNYSYVYTSDEDETRKKQEELLESQQKAYELSKDIMVSTQKNILSVLQQTRDSIADIMNDTSLTLEEKEARIKFLTENMQTYLQRETETFKWSQMNIVWDTIGVASQLTIDTTREFDEMMELFTKTAIQQILSDSSLTVDQQQQMIGSLLNQMQGFLSDETISFLESQLGLSEGALSTLVDFSGLTTENFLGVMTAWVEGNDGALTLLDARWDSSAYAWMDDLELIQDAEGNYVWQWVEDLGTIATANNDLLTATIKAYNEWFEAVQYYAGDIIGVQGEVTDAILATTAQTEALDLAVNDFIDSLDENINVVEQFQDAIDTFRGKLGDLGNELEKIADLAESLAQEVIDKEWELYDVNEQILDQLAEIASWGDVTYDSNGDYADYGYDGGYNSGTDYGYGNSNTSYNSSSGNNSGSNSSKKSGGYTAGDSVGFTGMYYYDSWGQEPAGNWYEGQPGAVRISSFSGTKIGGNQSNTGDYYVHLEDQSGGWLGWVKPNQIFDTGGYTGEWQDGMDEVKNGKLAVLHEKELVLNSSDTQNILQAVELVRDIFSGLTQAVKNNTLDLHSINQDKQDLNQHIQIEAHFPNATSENDIRNAILGLTNSAMQYAH